MRSLRPITQRALLLIVIVGFLSVTTNAFAAETKEKAAHWQTWVATQPAVTPHIDIKLPPVLAPEALDRNLVTAWVEKWTRPPTTLAWTNIALELIVKYQQNPVRAARALTLLHVAMSDAVVLAGVQRSTPVSLDVAVQGAASKTLAYLYPQELPGMYQALGRSAAAAMQVAYPQEAESVEKGWVIGNSVADQVVQRAMFDGTDRTWDPQAHPRSKPGLWRATPPLNIANPIEPLAGQWRTWVLKNGAEIQPAPPVPFDSETYWNEVAQVWTMATNLTPAQKQIADRWNLDRGTVTPAGVWNQIAMRLVRDHAFDSAHTAQVFATLNVAMMDAFIACWHAKFTWWTERPVTAIRDKLDPQFLPYLITPAFPSYVSGHATASGAAAEVLQAFFPDQRQALQAQAEEAALSRLYGGIHFPSDNQEGLALGKRVGARVLQRLSDSGTTR